MSSLPAALRQASGGFARDPRYIGAPVPANDPPQDMSIADPVKEAYARGVVEGRAEERSLARAEQDEQDARRGAIELAFARLDQDSADILRERLRQTVLALCEEAVMPLALDIDGLAARIDRAVALFRRAEDERRVLLHPDDLALIKDRLPAGLSVAPDPHVERGGLRIETVDGGVEDGPTQWRIALTEAFRTC